MYFLLLLFPAAILSRRCFYDVSHSRVQRDALSKPTIEELLYELISSDSSHFLEASQDDLNRRVDWLIRIFEIGMDKKRILQRKSEMLRFFRETAHVFSPHTNYVELANNIVPTLEEIAAKIRHFGYDPLQTLKMTYRKAFIQNFLHSSPEEQLAKIKESLSRTENVPAKIKTNLYISPKKFPTNCAHLNYCTRLGKCFLRNDEEFCLCDPGFKGEDCSQSETQREEIDTAAKAVSTESSHQRSTASMLPNQNFQLVASLLFLSIA